MSATELTGKQETAEENKSLPGTFGIGMVGVYSIRNMVFVAPPMLCM